MSTTFDLNIPDDDWAFSGPEGNEQSRLLACVCVNGIHHHLEAYQVKVDEEGIQAVADSSFESNYEGMCMASEPDGRYQTVEIHEREYVLVMTPYC